MSSGLRRARAARLWFDSLVFLAAGVAGPAWIVSRPWSVGGKAAAWAGFWAAEFVAWLVVCWFRHWREIRLHRRYMRRHR